MLCHNKPLLVSVSVSVSVYTPSRNLVSSPTMPHYAPQCPTMPHNARHLCAVFYIAAFVRIMSFLLLTIAVSVSICINTIDKSFVIVCDIT